MKTLGASEATVVKVEPTEAGGAQAVTVAVRYDDGRIEEAALRPDLVPDGLTAGERVQVTRAALYRRWTIARASEG